MILSDTPTSDASLIELFVVHVGPLSGQVGSDTMRGTSSLVSVPFGRVVFSDEVYNVVGFLETTESKRGRSGEMRGYRRCGSE